MRVRLPSGLAVPSALLSRAGHATPLFSYALTVSAWRASQLSPAPRCQRSGGTANRHGNVGLRLSEIYASDRRAWFSSSLPGLSVCPEGFASSLPYECIGKEFAPWLDLIHSGGDLYSAPFISVAPSAGVTGDTQVPGGVGLRVHWT